MCLRCRDDGEFKQGRRSRRLEPPDPKKLIIRWGPQSLKERPPSLLGALWPLRSEIQAQQIGMAFRHHLV